MNAIDKYNQRAEQMNSLVCVGLDSDMARLPSEYQRTDTPQYKFNRDIIDQTAEFTSAYKFNMAFYEARGEAGIHDLRLSAQYLRENYPDILTICDAKRSDIGNTSQAYACAIFEELGFDAVTLNPYLGRDAIRPFLEYSKKGCIILCRTSNSGSGELQNLLVDDKPLWQVIAEKVANEWNTNGNCMLVVGATYPEEMAKVRRTVGEMTFLVPGIGAQGGDIEAVVHAGSNSAGKGLILNSSRDIIFADDPGSAAKALRDEINRHRA